LLLRFVFLFRKVLNLAEVFLVFYNFATIVCKFFNHIIKQKQTK